MPSRAKNLHPEILHAVRSTPPGELVRTSRPDVDTQSVQFQNGNISLSPSDVTAYLGCRHLTTLSLQVAKKELAKPDGPERAGRAHLPQGARARGRLPAPLIDEGKTVTTIELEPDRDWERAARETVEAMRAGVDVVYQGVLASDGWRGQRRLPHARRDALATRRVELRGARHQARPPREARLHPPALLLQRADRADPGARAGAHPRAARERRRRSRSRRASSARTTGASAQRLEEFVGDAAARPSRSRARSAASATSSRSATRTGTRVDHLCRVAGISRGQIEKLERRGVATLAALGGGAPRRAAARRHGRGDVRAAPRAGRAAARGRLSHADSWKLLSRSRHRGFALLPDPSPGDLFFDFEGNPFWDPRAASSTSGASATATTRSRRLGDEPRGGAGGVRGVHRPRPRAARARTRTCTSTTTRSTRSRRSAG